MRVLVGSPVRQDPRILREFLLSLSALDGGAMIIDFAFFDDNDDDAGKRLLQGFRPPGSRVVVKRFKEGLPGWTEEYARDGITHYWKEKLVWKVAALKDVIIDIARKGDYDFLLMVDSDILMHPGIPAHLASLGKDIVSAVFWTRWSPGQEELPNVWISGQYVLTDGFLKMLRLPGTYEVGGLGACTLISKTALRTPISFSRMPNLTIWGEDRHFCARARSLGFKLHCDTQLPLFHIYRESCIGEGVLFRKRWYPGVGEV